MQRSMMKRKLDKARKWRLADTVSSYMTDFESSIASYIKCLAGVRGVLPVLLRHDTKFRPVSKLANQDQALRKYL